MATPVAGTNTQTSATPRQSTTAIQPNQVGGFITNPAAASDQGLASAEVLYVNQVGSATTQANGTTIALQPGDTYNIIPGTTTPVNVASASANHKFTAVCWPTP